jgi:putative transposase
MPSSYTSLYYHVVFSTKHRQPMLDEPLASQTHEYLGGAVRGCGGESIVVGGMPDHVHLLVRVPPATALADLLREIKANSSKWIHQSHPDRSEFAWQTGYGAFTVSQSGLERVKGYILNQANHHQTMSFEQEFQLILQKHHVSYDPSYLWD